MAKKLNGKSENDLKYKKTITPVPQRSISAGAYPYRTREGHVDKHGTERKMVVTHSQQGNDTIYSERHKDGAYMDSNMGIKKNHQYDRLKKQYEDTHPSKDKNSKPSFFDDIKFE